MEKNLTNLVERIFIHVSNIRVMVRDLISIWMSFEIWRPEDVMSLHEELVNIVNCHIFVKIF